GRGRTPAATHPRSSCAGGSSLHPARNLFCEVVMSVNKRLLSLLAKAGLLPPAAAADATEGQVLLRAVCPVHEGADNPSAFVLKSNGWFCNTRQCHSTYGTNLEGLVVGLAHRYGGRQLRFREALNWVTAHTAKLREVFDGWKVMKHSGWSGAAQRDHRF